ncbi:hypothetical protein PR048_011000 [Dryococelus australis]|uniref:DDE Tnp4 domain-containing protein n=1 Tax=Dryococelus australis TaxID=614101 RepID=A0ABQ9HKF0_9NEOP|nr:hypothetical protein PR048_011000 [Dryococelus australis]
MSSRRIVGRQWVSSIDVFTAYCWETVGILSYPICLQPFHNMIVKIKLEDRCLHGVLLGDSGYPQLPYFFTPILEHDVHTIAERRLQMLCVNTCLTIGAPKLISAPEILKRGCLLCGSSDSLACSWH